MAVKYLQSRLLWTGKKVFDLKLVFAESIKNMCVGGKNICMRKVAASI